MLMITATMRLLEMSDSQFPVGNFSFSNGLETASHEHIVHDAATLASYVRAATIQSIYSDGIASLHAYRAAERGDYDDIKRARWCYAWVRNSPNSPCTWPRRRW